MKKQRLEILQKVANRELTPEQADEQLLGLSIVGNSLRLSEDEIRNYLNDMKKYHQHITTKNRLEWYIAGVEEGLRKYPVLIRDKQ